MKGIVVAVVTTSLGATCPAAGELSPVGHVGGFVDAIATDGDAVFAGIGGTVKRLTTASPWDPPVWAGTWNPVPVPGEPGCCRGDLEFSEDVLYGAFDGWGLKTASAVDPDNLAEGVGFDSPLPATAVARVGQRIWIGTEGGGLLVLELELFADGFESGTLSGWSGWVGGP